MATVLHQGNTSANKFKLQALTIVKVTTSSCHISIPIKVNNKIWDSKFAIAIDCKKTVVLRVLIKVKYCSFIHSEGSNFGLMWLSFKFRWDLKFVVIYIETIIAEDCLETGKVGKAPDSVTVSLEFEPHQSVPLFPWARKLTLIA